jgi:hypothetical protein
MYEPIQAPPVHRPELVDPVTPYLPNIHHMTPGQVDAMENNLAFDTNFNDPQAFTFPSADRMRLSCWPGR